METQGYNPTYETQHDINKRQPFPNYLRSYDDEVNGDERDAMHQNRKASSRDKTKTTAERIPSSGGSVRSRRKDRQSSIKGSKNSFAPSLFNQSRRSSSSRKSPTSRDNEIRESANKCIENSF
eukprot:CAMPEP_0197193372 /NCGR_PEP_ID=MMETSP1423-20130617/27057_1 /TAXON_ID=476441 /ORGANISM="Pseudo-nitzschia heimii, Strain UNC1101" /LENGTH=122 /DNA_ID=CAMNT_0042646553 /DNA_START=95 /DNA_END=460 /DNA_ORIENTATION=+